MKQKSKKQLLQKDLREIKRSQHWWIPNNGKPIIGANEGEDRKEFPYEALRNITYQHQLLKPVLISKGSKTDLGSIPWLLKIIPGFRPTDPGMRAFLVHDIGYKKQLAERIILDAIMQAGLIADGMKSWQARLCYLGVRLFGGGIYRRHGERLQRENRKPYGEPD